ncbi:MAG: hypothetical protein NTX79_08150 [Candidatus Micrarchaeota archaeon]|nr:hypothetical protein [Candidatus Micrarchaeota archaeon]
MGGALVPRHTFLILLLALSLVPAAFAANPHQSGCTCTGKAMCGAPCSAGSECCSGSCDGECVRCLGIGDTYQNGMGACCFGLVHDANGKCAEPPPQSGSGNWYDNIYVWAGLAVIMSAAFIGLAYMASQLFQIRMLEGWVRIELGELATSMVIAVFCVALIATTNAAAQFLTCAPCAPGDINCEPCPTDVISASQQFMATLYGDGHALYSKLAIVYFNVAKVASYSYTAGTSIGGYATISYSSSPASGMSPLVSEVGQALDSVANYMLLAAAQAAFLKFFGAASLVMLPVGIFLRSFSFTRRLGATLLAATIAAAVIYPASVLLSQQVYNTFAPEMKGLDANGGGTPFGNVKVKDAENPPASSVVCNTYMQYFVQSPLPFLGGEIGWWVVVGTPICLIVAIAGGAGFIPCMSSVYQIISWIFMLLKAIFPILLFVSVFVAMENGTKTDKLLNDFYTPLHDYVLPAVAKFAVLSLATFIIPIIITLSLLRGFATMFGGEAQLYGLSKMI